MQLKFTRLVEGARTPTYASSGAACVDLYSTTGGLVTDDCPQVFDTGLAVEIPVGYALMIYSRSGHGFKNGVRLSNCVGVIDSDYRGEIKIKLAAENRCGLRVNAGDRIAQAMLIPVPQIELFEVGALSSTARGSGGFGSTGG